DVIAIIAEEGEDVDAAAKDGGAKPKQAKEEKPAPEKSEEKSEVKSEPEEDKEETPKQAPAASAAKEAPASDKDRIKVSPLARRLAEEKGVDLTAVKGSGPGGRIVKADIDAAEGGTAPAKSEAATPTPAPAAQASAQPAADDFEIPHSSEKLSRMRKTIARRLIDAKQTIPHYRVGIDVHIDKPLKLRGELNASLEPRGIKLSVNHLMIKAQA